MLRLTFIKNEKPTLTEAQAGLGPNMLEGPDEESILEQWSKIGWAAGLDPLTFRQKLLSYSGADNPKYVNQPCKLPATDDHILEAVVEASGPEQMTLEDFPTATDSIRKAIRQEV